MATKDTISAVVIGSTGAIGKSLVQQLLNNPQFKSVTTVGRRRLEIAETENNPKLKQIVVDLDSLKSVRDEIGNNDVAFSCLGTTRAAAGSAEAFRHIDFDVTVDFANIVKENGVKCFNLVSSQMASANSWFLYMKTKGQTEEKMKEIGFEKLNIFRPGLLDRKEKTRFNEKLLKMFVSSISVDTVAKAMINLAVAQMSETDSNSVNILDNSKIRQLACESNE